MLRTKTDILNACTKVLAVSFFAIACMTKDYPGWAIMTIISLEIVTSLMVTKGLDFYLDALARVANSMAQCDFQRKLPLLKAELNASSRTGIHQNNPIFPDFSERTSFVSYMEDHYKTKWSSLYYSAVLDHLKSL